MSFISSGNYLFQGVEEKVSKAGNPYTLVRVADTENFQQLEFFADSNLTINCGEKAKCKLVLDAVKNGYSTSMKCLSVNAL